MKTNWMMRRAVTPNKFSPLPTTDDVDDESANRGQVIVMFAIFLVAMMGVLGLATDVGYSMAAKRSVQGAADAGAMAGARMIARYTPSAPTAAIAEVTAVVNQNTFGSTPTTVLSCEYIGNNWSVVGTCNQNVPANAAGARVKTRSTVPTFFIRVIPGAPDKVTVGGYAKARVQSAAKPPADAPFIVCGTHSHAVLSDLGQSIDIDLPILSGGKIDPSAVGATFRIHDANLDKAANADCGSIGDKFKGLAKGSANAGKTANSWFKYDIGTSTGATGAKVDGAGGCVAGATAPYNCVMILPIATDSPAETGTNQQLYVIGFAAFQVTTIDANTHDAKLLDDYIIPGTGADNWCRDCGGTVVIRLIW